MSKAGQSPATPCSSVDEIKERDNTSGSNTTDTDDKYSEVKSNLMKYMLDYKLTSVDDKVVMEMGEKLQRLSMFRGISELNKYHREKNKALQLKLRDLQSRPLPPVRPPLGRKLRRSDCTTDSMLDRIMDKIESRTASLRRKLRSLNHELSTTEPTGDSEIFLKLLSKVKLISDENQLLKGKLVVQDMSGLKKELKSTREEINKTKAEKTRALKKVEDSAAVVPNECEDYALSENVRSKYIDYAKHSYVKTSNVQVLKHRCEMLLRTLDASIRTGDPLTPACLEYIENGIDIHFSYDGVPTDTVRDAATARAAALASAGAASDGAASATAGAAATASASAAAASDGAASATAGAAATASASAAAAQPQDGSEGGDTRSKETNKSLKRYNSRGDSRNEKKSKLISQEKIMNRNFSIESINSEFSYHSDYISD